MKNDESRTVSHLIHKSEGQAMSNSSIKVVQNEVVIMKKILFRLLEIVVYVLIFLIIFAETAR